MKKSDLIILIKEELLKEENSKTPIIISIGAKKVKFNLDIRSNYDNQNCQWSVIDYDNIVVFGGYISDGVFGIHNYSSEIKYFEDILDKKVKIILNKKGLKFY